MFDKNYLGHNLSTLLKYCISNDFVCTYCGIEIYYFNKQYITLINGKSYGICEINCEQYIIKNLIE